MTPARGLCPVCRRAYALRTDDTIRHHRSNRPGHHGPCPGTGWPPHRPVPAENLPTGRFGGPRPRPPDGPDPRAAQHRALLAAALRAA